MAQAVVDPAELKRFANNLKHFSSELQSQMALLRSQVMNLGQSWRDQEHGKVRHRIRADVAGGGPVHRSCQPARPLLIAQGRTH